MIRADGTVAEIRRRLAAAPAMVFRAFADAQMVSRWLSPSPDVVLTVLQFDFRVGGIYRFAYDVPGSRRMIVNGTYRTIEPHFRIIFSWNIEPPDEHAGLQSEVTVMITAEGGGSELVIRHENLTQVGATSRHAEGWRGALDQLTALLAAAEAQHDG